MQERAASTRQAVLEGAATSFEKFGYGTASLSTIIAYAGVSKGAMYFHFSSKEELAQAVIDAQLTMAATATAVIVDRTPKALDALILVTKELGRQLQTESISRGGMRLTLESAIADGPHAGAFGEWIAKIGDLVARAQTEGDVVDSVDAMAAGRYIVSLFTGVHTVSEMLTGRDDLQQRMTEMWQILLPGMVPRRRLPRLVALAEAPVIDWSDR